jgi:hypothetical protein
MLHREKVEVVSLKCRLNGIPRQSENAEDPFRRYRAVHSMQAVHEPCEKWARGHIVSLKKV